MTIHDRKDQLIYSLAGFQATIWVGLYSVGLWPSNPPCWYNVFWISFGIATLGMSGIFGSAIACFYYAKYSENSRLLQTPDAISRSEKLERWWKVPWNWHWKAFTIGVLGSLVAAFARFSGA